MADDSNARESPPLREEAPAPSAPSAHRSPRTPTIFVADDAAESFRIGETLRTAGYAVVDVPLSMLVTRAQADRPNVVLVDVDADGALDEVMRVRKLPGGGAVDFVYIGSGTGLVRNADDALTHDGSAFFSRPVDIAALVRRVESLTGGPSPRPEARPSTPPPSLSSTRRGSTPPDRPSSASLPAPGLRLPGPPLPVSAPSLADLVDPPRSLATFGTVSNELQQLLAEAELRAEVMPHPEVSLPTPEEEIEAVLPADVLASLDEPIEGDEDEEPDVRAGTGVGVEREGTGAHARGTTASGSRHTTASGSRSSPPHTLERRVASDRPPAKDTAAGRKTSDPPPAAATRPDRLVDGRSQDTRVPPSKAARSADGRSGATAASANAEPAPPASVESARRPTTAADAREVHSSRLASIDVETTEKIPSLRIPRLESVTVATVDLPTADGASNDPAPPRSARSSDGASRPTTSTGPVDRGRNAGGRDAGASPLGVVIQRPVDARRFLADAVSRHLTGALCFEHDRVVRRLVIRDGDFVTAASGADQESLVCFLGARGDLPRDEVERLAGKIPPYGRHAGAALVAHGWLGQDQLWDALRAHAEWIATCVARLGGGTAQLETEPPGRLRSEPSVFGAATGAEVFVEIVRRAVSPEEAIEALGGEGGRIGDGPSPNLLTECALSPPELELVSRARGGTVGDVLARATDPEIAAVLHGLALLGVIDVVPQAEGSRAPERSAADIEAAALDDEAIRARVRARLELVEEGDYFAVLGVPRDATSYEVRRAFVELRRAFEPTRILSPRLVDLADDVRKIVVVLEEAYEILRDAARRERYRRAIEARP